MSTTLNYRTPRLVKAKQGWYIMYSYKTPLQVRHLYNNKTWLRFRIIKDMNRRKGKDREDFANWLLETITESLRKGYNPFTTQLEYVLNSTSSPDALVTSEQAFKMFLDAWGQRGLEPLSLAKYKKFVNRLAEYLHKTGLLHADIKEVTTDHIQSFLNDGRKTYSFSNREYNNTFDFIRTCFNYLAKKGIIQSNPCAGIDKLKTKSSKHRFYDSKTLSEVTRALLADDPYTYLAAQTVYYACIRSDKELMNFRVSAINWEDNKILLDAEGAKGSSARYVPMDNNIKELFIKHGVDKYPGNYYVFGVNGTPAEKRFSHGFFARRFRKLRDKIGLSHVFTLYGFKHTRVVHLKQDGLSDADIMSLTGHKDPTAYAKYLRDLGLDANPEKINRVSRKL